jgi:hypothetical protein
VNTYVRLRRTFSTDVDRKRSKADTSNATPLSALDDQSGCPPKIAVVVDPKINNQILPRLPRNDETPADERQLRRNRVNKTRIRENLQAEVALISCLLRFDRLANGVLRLRISCRLPGARLPECDRFSQNCFNHLNERARVALAPALG